MAAALGNSKDYSLKQYLLFADKLQTKAKVSECPSFNNMFNTGKCIKGRKYSKQVLAVISDARVKAIRHCWIAIINYDYFVRLPVFRQDVLFMLQLVS